MSTNRKSVRSAANRNASATVLPAPLRHRYHRSLNARLVHDSVNLNPLHPTDGTQRIGRARWECRKQLDGPAVRKRRAPDRRNELAQVLIATEQHRNVKHVLLRELKH